MDNELNRRSYISRLRQQQKESTRDRILESVAELISEGRIMDFSVKEVSDRAEVSYASVYRHFPTRESILEALYETASEMMSQDIQIKPQALKDLPEMARRAIELFEERPNLTQAFTVALTANNIQPKSRNQRDLRIQEIIAKTDSQLSPEMVRQYAAIISLLSSSIAWVTLKGRFGLEAEEASEAIAWALETLTADLIRR